MEVAMSPRILALCCIASLSVIVPALAGTPSPPVKSDSAPWYGPLPPPPPDATAPQLVHATPIAITPKSSADADEAVLGPGHVAERTTPAPLTEAQRLKLASRPAPPSPAPTSTAKRADFSTSIPAGGTTVARVVPEPGRAPASTLRRGSDPTRVLGTIPRPEWSLPWRVKPAEVTTRSDSPSPEAMVRSAEEIQRGAAPTTTAPAAPKGPAVTTKGPPDANSLNREDEKPLPVRRSGKGVRP
jgi:hypothetical protein